MLRDNLVFFIQAHHEPRLYIPHALQQTYLQIYPTTIVGPSGFPQGSRKIMSQVLLAQHATLYLYLHQPMCFVSTHQTCKQARWNAPTHDRHITF